MLKACWRFVKVRAAGFTAAGRRQVPSQGESDKAKNPAQEMMFARNVIKIDELRQACKPDTPYVRKEAGITVNQDTDCTLFRMPLFTIFCKPMKFVCFFKKQNQPISNQ